MGSSASSSVSTLAETKVALGKLVSSYKAGFDKISLCDTHPKTNIEPENQSLKRRFLLNTLIFRLHVGLCSWGIPSPTIMDQVVVSIIFFSPLHGQMVQFDYVMFFNQLETINHRKWKMDEFHGCF